VDPGFAGTGEKRIYYGCDVPGVFVRYYLGKKLYPPVSPVKLQRE
jgi:hypothetical protein